MKVAELFEESKSGLNSQVEKAYSIAKKKPKYDAKKVVKKDWELYGSPEHNGKSERVVTTPDGKKKKITGQDDSHPRGGKQKLVKEAETKDMMGEKHEGCGGTFKETSQQDDMDGTLHCSKCGKEIERHLKEARKGAADPGPVGVTNPSPEAKKNRKMAQAVVAGYRNHIKTSGYNQTYAKKHRKEMAEEQVSEGKEPRLHLMPTAGIKRKELKGLADVKAAMTAVGGTTKKVGTDGLTYWIKNNKVHSKWDPVLEKGWVYSSSKVAEAVELTEAPIKGGVVVLKSKDGVEKRFKDKDSVVAKAWVNSNQKKTAAPKFEKYTQAWWDNKADADDPDLMLPWDSISSHSLDRDVIEAAVRHHVPGDIDNWHTSRVPDVLSMHGVHCAAVKVTLQYVVDKTDDLGVDEPTQDAATVIIRRDDVKPSKFVFVKFA